MTHAYLIPLGTSEATQDIKKSRFITYLAPAADRESAKRFINSIRLQHPSARHHCWAYVAGAPNDSQALGFSDDGEPSGTAGKPILAQLTGSGIGEIVAVVVRYYGGVLLGTGGLVKAYGHGVKLALQTLSTQLKVPRIEYLLTCDYHQLQLIESVINRSGGEIVSTNYTERVTVTLTLPVREANTAINKLRDINKGSLLLSPIKQ